MPSSLENKITPFKFKFRKPSFSFTESPVPLEFTPVLGILIGVVVTLLLVAFVIMLILRIKYKTSKRNNHENRTANQAQTDLEDDEEYFCLKPNERPMATLQRSHLRQNGNSGDNRHLEGDIEHNPDIIPGMNHHHHHHLNVQCAGKNLTI